jgi:opacity protein-like surface antigen
MPTHTTESTVIRVLPCFTALLLGVMGLLGLLCAAAPALAQDDYERSGVYVGGSGFWLGEQFGDDLNGELEEALELDDADLSVGDSRGAAGILGVRMGSRFALELVGERYDDLDFDLVQDGIATSGDLELWTAMLMGKVFLFTGRIQPYLMAGAGYARGEADAGDIDEVGHAALGRAGLGVDLYLNEHWVFGVQGAYSRGLGNDLEDLAYFTAGGSITFRF